MKLLFISILFSSVCFGQDTTKVDSMDVKVISMREFQGYLDRINIVAQKQFNITEIKKFQEILREIQKVYTEADRKRKVK